MIAKNFYKTLGFKKIAKNKWLYELKRKYKNKNDIIDYQNGIKKRKSFKEIEVNFF